MGSLYGWLTDGRVREENARLGERVGQLLSPGGSSQARSESSRRATLGFAGAGDGDIGKSGGVFAVVSGDAAWTCTKLAQQCRDLGMPATLAAAYRRDGPDVFRHLRGAFTLAIVDDQAGEAVLAVDRMGIGSMTYARPANGLVFASTADAVLAHPDVSRDIDHQGLYNYVYFHVVPGPGTVYRGLSRLEAGHYAVFKDGRLHTQAYWEPEYRENTTKSFTELKGELLEHLREGVRRVSGSGRRVGAFLSGGTDSSTVAGILTEVGGHPAKTYSIGFEAQGYDEMEYARTAARHFGTDHHEYYVTPDDVVAAIPEIAGAYDQPYGNSSAVPTYYCARLAKDDGIDTLLGGDGGDELFGGNSRYAKQHIFEMYDRVPKVLRRALLEPLLFSTPAIGKVPQLRKLRSYVDQASIPMPRRMETYNFLNRFGTRAVFTDDFLASVDRQAPLDLLSHIYTHARADTLLNRMLAIDLRITLADNDLPKVTRMCELAGVKAVFPLLDAGLVDFSLRLPSRLKLRGTKLRYFFKEALRDFLPEKVVTKRKHGFGLPFGLWLHTYPPLQALARDALGTLGSRHIFNAAFIDSIMNRHLTEHPAYYGEMVWVMVMLELWYRQRVDDQQ